MASSGMLRRVAFPSLYVDHVRTSQKTRAFTVLRDSFPSLYVDDVRISQ
jgi:hypothetical protein